MSIKEKLAEKIDKSTLANIVAVIGVIMCLGYFIETKDTESLKWIAGISVGWLFKEIRS